MELSYGDFDVIFFPEKLNFLDASQEKFEIRKSLNKIFNPDLTNFPSDAPIYKVSYPCLVTGKMLMLSVRLCFNTYQATMRQKYGQQLLTVHLGFKMDSKNGGILTQKNIWVSTDFIVIFKTTLNVPIPVPRRPDLANTDLKRHRF